MNARVVATVLGLAGAATLVFLSVQSWRGMRVAASLPRPAPGESVHTADPVALAALEAVIVALGLSAGWPWAVALGLLGCVAILRYARRSRVSVTADAVVFGSGSAAVDLPLAELGALVPAPRNGAMRSYGTLGFADRSGSWVGVVRPAAMRHAPVMAATVVDRAGLRRHDGEDGWRAPGATAPTGRLPYFST